MAVEIGGVTKTYRTKVLEINCGTAAVGRSKGRRERRNTVLISIPVTIF